MPNDTRFETRSASMKSPRRSTKGASEGSTGLTATSTQPTALIRSSRLTRTGLGRLSDRWTRTFFIQQLALGSSGDRLQDRGQLFGDGIDAIFGGRRSLNAEEQTPLFLPVPPAGAPARSRRTAHTCSAGGIEVMAAGAVMEPAPYGARFAMIASASPPERICNWLPVIWNVAADWSAARNCCSCCITPAGDSQAILVVIGGLTDSVLPPAW